jgi:hypothetical protein
VCLPLGKKPQLPSLRWTLHHLRRTRAWVSYILSMQNNYNSQVVMFAIPIVSNVSRRVCPALTHSHRLLAGVCLLGRCRQLAMRIRAEATFLYIGSLFALSLSLSLSLFALSCSTISAGVSSRTLYSPPAQHRLVSSARPTSADYLGVGSRIEIASVWHSCSSDLVRINR